MGKSRHNDVDEAVRRLLSRQRPHESDTAFAERIGQSQQTLSNWKLGKAKLSREKAVSIAEETGWSLDWLLRGEVSEGAGYKEGVADARNAVHRRVEDLEDDLEGLEEGFTGQGGAERLQPRKAPPPQEEANEEGRESA